MSVINTRSEKNYEFRQRLLAFHEPGLRDHSVQMPQNAFVITADTDIIVEKNAPPMLRRAAEYLRDFLSVSMETDVRVVRAGSGLPLAKPNVVIITTNERNPVDMADGDAPRGFRMDTGDNIVITGYDDAGALMGVFRVADICGLNRAPYIVKGMEARSPLFSPRMAHSGYGLDDFPDAHLTSLSRAGMDAILVFVKGVDETPYGYLDFNNLCRRAADWGLGVYAYSYLKSAVHPEDPAADTYYEKIYGSVFKACPLFKGVVLVGESVEFPSRDTRTTGRSYKEPSPDGLPDHRPSPGWWPCSDYPAWLGVIKKTVRNHIPDADIVFWTYNWGYVGERERLELIDSLPTDISLHVTFEMFENIPKGPIVSRCVDYTLMFAGPGKYFVSEAAAAAKRGIRLYAMTNTGGLTWDVGVIPYEPAPYQWMKRYAAILDMRGKYGLRGLMDNHHYGFYPSFVAELAREAFTKGAPDAENALRLLAKRDFGDGANEALKAYALLSEGIANYISTNEDQYGPFRIGPAYPLILGRSVKIPESPFAYHGSLIFNLDYRAYENNGAPPFLRLKTEIGFLYTMRDKFFEGAEIIYKLAESQTGAYRDRALRLAGLARFIGICAQTTIHVKQWYMAKCRFATAETTEDTDAYIKQMREIANAEIINAEKALPLAAADSRIGWEPTMEYMCDEAHINWKIKQVRYVLDHELKLSDSRRGI